MGMLMDRTVQDFNHLLASQTPAPGGGSTAALAGVLGSALTIMVVNLTVGKKSYEALAEGIKNKIVMDYATIKVLNEELTKLVDEDTQAFNLVMEAMKLPNETAEDKIVRANSMQKANLYALQVPLVVAEKCLQILEHQQIIALYGNKNAVSDLGVGAILALAGLEGALLNVQINVIALTEQSIIKDAVKKHISYRAEGEKLKNEIIAIVNRRIGEG